MDSLPHAMHSTWAWSTPGRVAEWSIVEWSGAEYSGVEWSGWGEGIDIHVCIMHAHNIYNRYWSKAITPTMHAYVHIHT